ncbi:anticodon-binding aminoacyl-tRNA synthetase, class 1a [Tanacetum coccineum]
MAETMEQYMRKKRTDYESRVARPKIEEKNSFELKGQFLKELQENTFSGSTNDLSLPISLTGAASRWLRNEQTGSIKTWEDLKTKFLNKYYSPGRTAKKMEEINNFQQELDETLFQAWERFKEILMKCPQHYLTEMPEENPYSDAEDEGIFDSGCSRSMTDEAPILWSALAGWEVISTPLGEINALYRSDQSTKHFTTLREILHMVDRQDLLKLYGMVVTYYENHLLAGGWIECYGIRSWRLYTLSNVHVLETVSGEVLYMFADVSYPLSVKLMERMLKHKLEIDKDVVVNDMTTAEQLIRFIKNQNAAAQVSPV